MGTLFRVGWAAIKGVLAAVLGATGIEICHQFKWYPDKDLAKLLMATPNHISLTLAYWIAVAIIAVPLLFAEHWLVPYVKNICFGLRGQTALSKYHFLKTSSLKMSAFKNPISKNI